MTHEITLYRKHSGGRVGTWHCLVEHGRWLRYGHATVEGGSISWFQDEIVPNSSGRSLEQQAQLEHDSRVRRMLQRGYKATREEAAGVAHGTNQHGLPMPMLAHPIGRVSVTPTSRMWVQPKFDGHRAITVHDGADHLTYSRKGTPISPIGSIDHLMTTIREVVPPDVVLDGELYVHGRKLQTIASWIKRKQPDSQNLTYVLYDVMMDEPYSVRSEVLRDVGRMLSVRNHRLALAPTWEIDALDEAFRIFRCCRDDGYEGAMLRLDGVAYRPGVRSSALLKIKEREEGEFPVVGVVPTKVGANVVLRAANGRTFETPAPGTHEEKARYLTDESIWKGKKMTCEWAEWTADGFPFHCVALQIREDV